MKKDFCDLCEKELDEIYSLKLYKGFLSDEFFSTEHICFDCYIKIKKFIKTI